MMEKVTKWLTENGLMIMAVAALLWVYKTFISK